MSRIGTVVIGRNEGERLRRCLGSLRAFAQSVVYVDSGSTDGSPELARDLGATVVDLDMTTPFTAARARNAGLMRLLADDPGTELIQFVDGDCEVVEAWIDAATAALDQDTRTAVVCGRTRERARDATLYNRLCDLEWENAPFGETKYCGGNALMRVTALREVGGYHETLIAGEEPELCVRLRQRGWRIRRIAVEMTLHDANMTRFRQWWRRSQRAGYAYAEGAAMHGALPERHWVRERRSLLFWGLILPLLVGTLFWSIGGWALLLLAAYPMLFLRVFFRQWRRSMPLEDAALWAASCVMAKFSQVTGALEYYLHALAGRRRAIIDWRSD